jgi:hypothetical protein
MCPFTRLDTVPPPRAPPAPAGAAGPNPARNRLEPRPPCIPAPFGETWPRTGRTPHPWAHPAVNKNQGPRVRGAYRGDCGWIECPNQLVGWSQPPCGAAPRRPHGSGRILFTCTFLRLRGRGGCILPAAWRRRRAICQVGLLTKHTCGKAKKGVWSSR